MTLDALVRDEFLSWVSRAKAGSFDGPTRGQVIDRLRQINHDQAQGLDRGLQHQQRSMCGRFSENCARLFHVVATCLKTVPDLLLHRHGASPRSVEDTVVEGDES